MQYKRNNFLYKLTRCASKIFLYPLFSITVEGIENLPDTGAFILLPKHQRWVDIPVIAIAVPKLLYYIAKHEMFRNPLSRWFISSVGGISLNRKRPIESRRSLNKMMGHLENGEGVVVFPEGTYYRDKMGPGNLGIIKFISSRRTLPFIPVGINYKKGMRTKILVKIGNPANVHAVSPGILLKKIMNEISGLSGLK